jgi:hypothetical protein
MTASAVRSVTRLTPAAWLSQFDAIPNARLQGRSDRTHFYVGADDAAINSSNPQHLWSLLPGGRLVNGLSRAQAVAVLITRRPWEGAVEVHMDTAGEEAPLHACNIAAGPPLDLQRLSGARR